MQKLLAKYLGFFMLPLGVAGILRGEGLLIGLLNADLALDVIHLSLAMLLLYAAYVARDEGTVRLGLLVFGATTLLISAVSVLSPSVLGLMPHEFTGFDILWHSLAGVAALGVMASRDHTAFTPA
jgi:hypothetical protein